MSELAPVKPYSSRELAELYGIGRNAMRSWFRRADLQALGPQVGRYWNVNQVKKIFDHFGHPEIETNPKP